MNRHRARQVLLDVPGMSLSKQDVDVLTITQLSSGRATVDANVRLAFELVREDGAAWRVEHVRLGSGQWEAVDRLRAALDDVRWTETCGRLLEIAQALLAWRAARGTFPEARDIVTLTDQLHPRYMPRLVRSDAWGGNLRYERLDDGAGYRVVAPGPDGQVGTADDLEVRNGRLTAPARASSP